jgi:hypothetical protein
MNKVAILVIMLLFPVIVMANEGCNKIVPGYEKTDSIYVICDDLSEISDSEANILIKDIFAQYQGPADEIFVFFVSSADYVGKFDAHPFEVPAEKWVADYYTHSNQLTLWPKLKKKTRTIKIKWE